MPKIKYVVIPDVHQNVKWAQTILNRYPDAMNFVLLGDYFDAYPTQGVHEFLETCDFLLRVCQNPKCIVILGNHDLPYIFPNNPLLRCGGNQEYMLRNLAVFDLCDNFKYDEMFRMIRAMRKQGRLFYYDFKLSILFSHAGVNPWFIPFDTLSSNHKDYTITYLLGLKENALANALGGLPNPFLMAGKARCGTQEVGGIVWQDWDKEFESLPHIKQIVGHSKGKSVRIHRNGDICCDCNQTVHLTIEQDGQINVVVG